MKIRKYSEQMNVSMLHTKTWAEQLKLCLEGNP